MPKSKSHILIIRPNTKFTKLLQFQSLFYVPRDSRIFKKYFSCPSPKEVPGLMPLTSINNRNALFSINQICVHAAVTHNCEV